MENPVDFLIWLAQTNPDCLSRHAMDEDWGKKAFTKLHNEFLKWKGEQLVTESQILQVMQDADDTLAENDYNIGYLNGMEKILSVLQQRNPNFIPPERLKSPKEAMQLKNFNNNISPSRKIKPGHI